MDNYFISQQIKGQFERGKYEPYEVVVALITMVKAGHIKKKDIKVILLNIFPRDEALGALIIASNIIDNTLINDIIAEVHKETL